MLNIYWKSQFQPFPLGCISESFLCCSSKKNWNKSKRKWNKNRLFKYQWRVSSFSRMNRTKNLAEPMKTARNFFINVISSRKNKVEDFFSFSIRSHIEQNLCWKTEEPRNSSAAVVLHEISQSSLSTSCN